MDPVFGSSGEVKLHPSAPIGPLPLLQTAGAFAFCRGAACCARSQLSAKCEVDARAELACGRQASAVKLRLRFTSYRASLAFTMSSRTQRAVPARWR